VPAVLICATLTFAVALIASRLPASKLAILYLKALTFFPYGPWIDGVYWTLPIEISFYALVLALLWMRCFDRLELVMAAVGLSSAAYWIARFAGVGGKGRAFELLLVSHGCLFALGVFIWLGVFKGWRWWRVAAVGLLIPAGYLCVMLQAKFFAALALPPASPHVAANLWLASVVLIVVSAELDEIIQTSIPGAGLRALRFLGLMTYPLYLLNDLIGAAIIGDLARSGVDRYLALAAALAAVVALAAAVTAWAEPAVRRVLAARLSGLATRDEARTA
jgi:peptidoglycan/LPS O-acetylase OafA/YrhL